MTAVPSKPVFGLWTLVALVVGNAVGAGISVRLSTQVPLLSFISLKTLVLVVLARH